MGIIFTVIIEREIVNIIKIKTSIARVKFSAWVKDRAKVIMNKHIGIASAFGWTFHFVRLKIKAKIQANSVKDPIKTLILISNPAKF